MQDLLIGRLRVRLEQLARHQHEPWRAKPALECTCVDECLLNVVEDAVAFYRLDARAIGENGQIEARGYRSAVNEDRTAAAESLTATLARPEESESILQEFDQCRVRLDLDGLRIAVTISLHRSASRLAIALRHMDDKWANRRS